MTTLTKIRNRAGLLVGIIAFALFAFVMGDLFRSGFSIFGDDPKLLGEINGRKVNIGEFEARLDKAMEQAKQQQQKASLDDQTIDMIRQQTWNQLVYESLMEKEYEKLGVAVSTDELMDMVQGKNPHPQVIQAFTDPKTGQFNPSAVITFLKQMDQDQSGETKQRWLQFEKAMKSERIMSKYNNLIKGAMYITKAQAKRDYTENGKKAKVRIVSKRITEIPDAEIKITDTDISNYYNQNKNKYKSNESTRGVEFVLFESMPSPEDRMEVVKQLEKIKAEFAASKEDTIFINANSDIQDNIKSYKKGTLPLSLDTVMFSQAPGYVAGPVFEAGSFKLAKLIGKVSIPDSVKARHILVKGEPGKMEKAKAKIDSIKKLIQGGAKFDQVAQTLSEDEGSKGKGGDLGWFQEGTMVKPFNDACFNGKKGDLQVVESQFGVHLIEVLDKGKESPRVQVAMIDRELRPSSKTYQTFYAKASEFAGKNNTSEKFEAAIVEGGLNKRIADNIKETDRNLPGVDGARELVKWAFTQAKLNDISQVYDFGGKFVIAKLTSIKDKGFIALESVKKEVEIEVRREKKAEMLAAKMEEAIKGASGIDAVAAKLNAKVDSLENITFAAGFIPNMGREPELTAAIFTTAKGKISPVIKGETGVYVFVVDEIAEPAPATDLKQQIAMATQQFKQRADYEIFEAIREKADIKDNRIKFY